MASRRKYAGKEIRYTICPVGNASYLAARKGWISEGLSRLGATATLLQTLPQDRWAVHYNYQDAALFREGGNIPPIWSRANGEEPVLIGLTFLDHKQYLLVRADSPIDSVEQLRKRRLGLQSRPEFLIDFSKASAQRGFETALAARGVAREEVAFVEFPVSESAIAQRADKKSNSGKREVEALENGEADVMYASGTRAQKLLETGNFKVIFEISGTPRRLFPAGNSYPNILTVSRQLADEAPEIVVEYLKQLLHAAAWAQGHRSEVLELFAQQTHGTTGQVAGARSFDFHKHLAPELSAEGFSALESQKRFLFDHGYIKKDFAIEKWADDRFLKTALAQTAKPLL